MLFFHRSAICALTVTAVTLSCGLAARAQVGVMQPVPVAPVGVAPMGEIVGVTTAPVIGAAAVGGLGGVKASGVNTGLLLLLGQIADGQMTLDDAWEKGSLDAPKVLQLLGQSQRLTEDESNETLQRDLASLLVRLAPATVATPERLSARVRVALCRYYSSVGDARAVPLCEALIAEKLDGKQIKQPLASNLDGGSSSLWLSSVILLAQYYEKIGEWQKAGETWERALGFWQDKDDWQASIRIEAAASYGEAGQTIKAQLLYDETARSSNGFYASGAIFVSYSKALQHNSLQTEKNLLELEKSLNTPEARLVVRFLLAWQCYRAGNWKDFLQQSRQLLAQYETMNATFSESCRRYVFAPFVVKFEDAQKWALLWQSNTVVVENPNIDLKFAKNLQQPVERRIFVNTPTPSQLEVSILGDVSRVQARLEVSPWATGIEEVRHQQIVVVTITPGLPQVKAVVQLNVLGKPLQKEQFEVTVTPEDSKEKTLDS